MMLNKDWFITAKQLSNEQQDSFLSDLMNLYKLSVGYRIYVYLVCFSMSIIMSFWFFNLSIWFFSITTILLLCHSIVFIYFKKLFARKWNFIL
jgi:hypothetical protein